MASLRFRLWVRTQVKSDVVPRRDFASQIRALQFPETTYQSRCIISGIQSKYPLPDMRNLLAMIVTALLLLSPNVTGAVGAVSGSAQTGQTQQEPPSSAPAAPENHGQKTATKPCSEAQSKSPSQSGCKASSSKAKSKKPTAHSTTKSADSSSGKTVVRNGGTGEPSVGISPDEGQRQAARIQETNRLLAAADMNLKDVAVRGLNASQEVTVKQIRSYMDQAKTAENSGDVERAYTLANKANMLAADLNGR